MSNTYVGFIMFHNGTRLRVQPENEDCLQPLYPKQMDTAV